MSVVILVAGMAALVTAYLAGASAILLGISLLLILYLLVVLHDLRAIRARLAKLCRDGVALKHRQKVSLVSQLARNINAMIEALEYRMDALLWQVDVSSKGHVKAYDRKLIEKMEETADKQPLQSVNYIYDEILDNVFERFRCQSASIVLREEGVDFPLKVIGRGIEGRRFNACLWHLLKRFFVNGDEACFGMQDSTKGNSVLGAFSFFGVHYTITFPFRISLGVSDTKGVLWLGYTAEAPPLEIEVVWAQELVKQIENDLASFHRIDKLSQQVNAAESQSKEKNDFIAHMSHDIRSPLNNIKSILGLLQLEEAASDRQSLVEMALNNCDSLKEIVEDILDYSKHNVGRLKARAEVLELGGALKEIVESFRVAAELKGLDLKVKNDLTRLKTYVDKKHFKRILTNIISNAIKYTNSGEILVYTKMQNSETLKIVVKDSGIGMGEAQLAQLFTPFTRFDAKQSEGVGLGLALSRILVELNNGQINVSSRVNVGSEFEVSFPIAASKEKSALLEENRVYKAPAVSTQSLVSLKVLVVDDDMDFVETVSRALSAYGLNVAKAVSVNQAINICNFEVPDVLITDASMPQGGGQSILRYLQSIPAYPAILVLSGKDSEEQRQSFLALGAASIMQKPVDIKELVAWIGSVVGNGEREVVG